MCAQAVRSAALQESAKADEEAFRAQLRRISHFFDRLVDMVPAKHYIDDGREDAGSMKYMKKAAKLEAKQQRKEAGKKRKRENLDPDRTQSTLEVQVTIQLPGSIFTHLGLYNCWTCNS